MTNHAVLANKAVWISVACTLIVAGYDFFTRVTVPLTPENNRGLDWAYNMPSNSSVRDMPDSLTQWLQASEKPVDEASQSSEQTIPNLPGSSKIGEVNVRIRAIFTGDEEFALAEVQLPAQQPQRRLLRKGDSISRYRVTEMSSEYVLLQLDREFKASSGVAADPKYLYVFEPRNTTDKG